MKASKSAANTLTVLPPAQVGGIGQFLRYMTSAKVGPLEALPQGPAFKIEPVGPNEIVVGKISADLRRLYLIAGNLDFAIKKLVAELKEARTAFYGHMADGEVTLTADREFEVLQDQLELKINDLYSKFKLAFEAFTAGINLDYAAVISSTKHSGRLAHVREGFVLVLLPIRIERYTVAIGSGGISSMFGGEFSDMFDRLARLGALDRL